MTVAGTDRLAAPAIIAHSGYELYPNHAWGYGAKL
jgi:hypothetical protein